MGIIAYGVYYFSIRYLRNSAAVIIGIGGILMFCFIYIICNNV